MKATKRHLEIVNQIKGLKDKYDKDVYIVYNQFSKIYDIATINFDDIEGERIKYNSIGTIKTTINTLYNMISNGLLKEITINNRNYVTLS